MMATIAPTIKSARSPKTTTGISTTATALPVVVACISRMPITVNTTL